VTIFIVNRTLKIVIFQSTINYINLSDLDLFEAVEKLNVILVEKYVSSLKFSAKVSRIEKVTAHLLKSFFSLKDFFSKS
jgi:hypothetical protein